MSPLDGELDVEKADHAQLEGQGPRLAPGAAPPGPRRWSRAAARRPSRRSGSPAFSMCSMTPADQDVLAVAERVDVDLDGVLEELVDQDRVVGRDARRARASSSWSRALLVDDLHGPAAQDVGRPDQDRVAEARWRSGPPRRPSARCRWAAAARPSFRSSSAKRSRSSARSMASGEVPRIGTPGPLERHRELERRLAPELDDHAQRPLPLDDVEDVLEGQRLEVEAVGGVVVGGHRLGVAVDHDGLDARLAEGEGGVHAA